MKDKLADMESLAKYYINELIYLQPRLDVELKQGRKYCSKLVNITEALELKNARQSLIDLCWSSVSNGLKKFK